MPHKLTLILIMEELENRWLPSGLTASPTYLVCHAQNGVVNSNNGSSSTPIGLTPAQIRQAYGIDSISFPLPTTTVPGDGSGQTMAIVDAQDDPTVATDLAVFDNQFGIPAPPSFTKVGINANDQVSTTTFPAPDPVWAGEIDLDVEWAHAVAPQASLLLVEANSDDLNDLLNAIDYARNYPGVSVVSISWGGNEFTGEGQYDSYFTTPPGHTGVTFVASAGDNGSGVAWPAVSDHVLAVGGTTLTLDSSGNYQNESAWSGSGGGVSSFVPQPSYQKNLVLAPNDPSPNGMRVVPDVAYDADPNTGMAAFGIYSFGGWVQAGGTSLAAPQWAGLIAIANQGRALANQPALDGYTQTLPDLYQLPPSDFNDVTTGNNGYPAGPGFDLVTGLGTPVANKLVPDLAAATTPQTLTSILVLPGSTTIKDGNPVQLSAIALDQFGLPMVAQPAFTWSLDSSSNNLSTNGLYTAPSTGTGTDTVLATFDGSPLAGSATVNYLPGPAIAGLSGNPSPVAGTTTSLSADVSDFYPGTLNYTWAVLTEPNGAAPTFSSATGSAGPGPLSTTVTFNLAGSYVFQLSVTDGAGLTSSGTVTVAVNQTLTSIQVAPGTALLPDGNQQQFTAIAQDQFGQALSSQPNFQWLVNGQGNIAPSGLYKAPASLTGTDQVQALVNGVSGSATIGYLPAVQINSITFNPTPVKGTTTFTVQATDLFSSTLSYTWALVNAPLDVPAPYLNPAWGTTTNGTITTQANFFGVGTYVFQLTIIDSLGKSASQEVTVTTPSIPPTITWTSNPPAVVTGTSLLFSAQATSNNPGPISYFWSEARAPSGVSAPYLNAQEGSISNGTTINSTAAFFGAGTYQFQLTVTDSWNLSTVQMVTVTVDSLLKTITLTPASMLVPDGGTLQIQATARDQFGNAMNPQPSFTWSMPNGGPGSVSSKGLYTAPALGTGTVTLQASANGIIATTTVMVYAAPPTILSVSSAQSTVTGTNTTLSVVTTSPSSLTYTWTAMNSPAGAKTPVFSINNSSTANKTVVTFSRAGCYAFQVKVTNQAGLSNYGNVYLSVNQTATSLAVSSAKVKRGTSQALNVVAYDQFGNSLTSSPSCTWSLASGLAGTSVSSAGVFSVSKTAAPGLAVVHFKIVCDGITFSTLGTITIT